MFGSIPYNKMHADEIIRYLESGSRLSKPDTCPPEFYENILLKCWEWNSDDRPKFDVICADLDQLLESESGVIRDIGELLQQ